MNYLELNNREVELVPTAQPLQNRHPRCPRSEGELNQQRDLFLNDSLRSANSSINGDDSQASIGDPDDSQEGEALLDQRHYPNPNIAALYRVLYDYLRFGLAAFFFLYSFYLLFSAQGQCYNGSGSLKKLPKIKCDMYEISHTDLRIIYSAVLVLVLDPFTVSVLPNLLHRKHMIQLQVTLVVWIVFVINNAEDELMYSPENFPERWEENKVVRYLLDMFYGFSVVRRKSVVVNICYFIFDMILFPNSLFFSIMVSLFFLLILVILLITMLNFLGWANIDLDQYAGQQLNHRHGLTPIELDKLETAEFCPADHSRHSADEPSEVMCSICFMPFEQQVLVTYLPQCNHFFHQECIREWFKSHGTCPICRLNIKGLLKEEEDEANGHFLNRSIFEIADI